MSLGVLSILDDNKGIGQDVPYISYKSLENAHIFVVEPEKSTIVLRSNICYILLFASFGWCRVRVAFSSGIGHPPFSWEPNPVLLSTQMLFPDL